MAVTTFDNGGHAADRGNGDRPHGSRRRTESVTLEDVAKIAGVSTITVSRAINNPDKVAAATLERVNQAIERTGYVPNLLAGGLASSRSRLIAAVIPSIANHVYAETIQYFSETLKDAGYQVLLGESGYPEDSEETLISAVLSRRPDGIFMTGTNHSAACRRRLMAARIPVVETWEITPTPLDIAVGFSHPAIGRAVGEFIVAKGFRKIGVVTADDRRAEVRNKATLAVLKANGITDVAVSVVPAITSLMKGRAGMARLLDEGFRDGVVFCSSDTLAHGVLIEAQSRGLTVPQDLSVIGFGDQDFAAYTFPALTTVRIYRSAIGRLAAEALLARINGDPIAETVIDTGFAFIERETA